jgi:hypothetical protein
VGVIKNSAAAVGGVAMGPGLTYQSCHSPS